MRNAPSNTDDVIDSRDIIARIAELEDERDQWNDRAESRQSLSWDGEFPDDAADLAALQSLAAEAEGYAPDWRHGETLIRDSYFEDYARELAEDIGAVKGDESWPLDCIDWEKAARQLRCDYTAVEFDGVTYWIRS